MPQTVSRRHRRTRPAQLQRAPWLVLTAAACLVAPEAARAGCEVTGGGLINCDSSTIDIRPSSGTVTAVVDGMTVSGGSLNLIPANDATGPITATLTVTNTNITRPDYGAINVASTIPGGPVVHVSVFLGPDVTLNSTGGFGGLWVRNEWGGNIVVNSAATVTATGADGLTATTNNGFVSLTNSGHVTSTDNRGLYADGGFSNTSAVPVTISNSGTVSAYLAGMRVIDYNGTATALNSGTVTSATRQAMIAWSASNGDVVMSNSGLAIAQNHIGVQAASQTGNAIVTNSGRIEAYFTTPGNAHQGINAQAGFDTSEVGWGNVTVTNTASGVIIAPSDSAIYAWTPRGTVTVQNAGSLSGAMGITADTTSGSVSILNTGSITASGAAIVTGAAPATLANAGSIATTAAGGTAVQFGSGNNTLLVLPGSSIRGLVTNGAVSEGPPVIGVNTLTLGGTGNASFDVSQIDRTPAQRGLAFNGTAYVGTGMAAAGQYQGFSLFTKTDAGTWTLSYGNGGGLADQNWSIQGGTLIGDSTSLRGASILNNATLVFNQAGSGTYAGTIGGSGGLVVTGGGALTLSGSNTYAGGTIIRGATLRIASDTALGNAAGSLTFDNGTLQALANITSSRPIIVTSGGGLIDTNGFLVSLLGPITLNGQLSKIGTGNVLFSSDAEVNGTLVVGNGIFANNGVVSAQQVQVLPGGVLRGSGVVNAPTTVFGTLYPGNSPGTLTFNAPVTMQPGSTLALDVDGPGTGSGAGNYGRVVVQGAGNAFTAGGTLQPVLRGITGSATNSFTPSLGQTFTVVQAQGGVLGSFAGLAQPPAGLPSGTRFEAVYTAQTVSLALAPSAYGALDGRTANQGAVGAALDALRPAPGVRPGAGLGDGFGRLYQLPGASIAATLDRLAGTAYGDQLLADRETQRLVGGAVDDQLSGLRGGGDASGRATTLADGRGRTAWIRALGQNQRVHSGEAPGFSGNAAGFVAGADMRVENAVLGLAVGHTNGLFTSRGTGAKTDTDMVHLIAYGSVSLGRYFLDGQLGGHMTSDTTRRDLGIFGSSARGRVDGSGVSAQARVGAVYAIQGWRLEPSLAMRFDHTARDGLTETGAGGLGLAVNRTSIDGARASASIRLDREIALSTTVTLAPSVRLGYGHDFGDVAAVTSAAFIGAPAAGYRVTSARTGRDAFLAGLGATVKLPRNLAVFVNYAADIRGSGSVQAVTGGLRFTW